MGNKTQPNEPFKKEEEDRVEEMINIFTDRLIDLLWQQAQLNLKKRGGVSKRGKKSQKDLL